MPLRRTPPMRRPFGLQEVYQLCSKFSAGGDLNTLCKQFRIRETSFWHVWRRYNGWRWHELTQYREMRRQYKQLMRTNSGKPMSRICKLGIGRVHSGQNAVQHRASLVIQIYELQQENDRLQAIIAAFKRNSQN